jgi:hypothetical protein
MSDNSRAHETHTVWSDIAPEITPRDFRFPHQMRVGTLKRLSRVRRKCKVPFRFVSDHRPPERNAAVGGATGSAHMGVPCCAVDLRVQSSVERFAIVRAALEEGFARIGIYPPTESQRAQWGKNSGSVHLDDSPTHAPSVMWVSV